MSIVDGILGFFTGNKTADSIVDGVKKAGDMLVFTEEEKSLANQKGLELYIKYQEATLPQNVTRRHIAIVVIVLWSFFLFSAFIFALIGIFSAWQSFVTAGDFTFKMVNENINTPFSIIIGFYFLKRIVQK